MKTIRFYTAWGCFMTLVVVTYVNWLGSQRDGAGTAEMERPYGLEYLVNNDSVPWVNIRVKDRGPADQVLISHVRVLCIIVLDGHLKHTRMEEILNMWASRCNKAIFVTSSKHVQGIVDADFGDMAINPGGIHGLDMRSLDYVYQNYHGDYDWFLKVDNRTFVIPENLRHFLANKDPRLAISYGRLCKKSKILYFASEAGVILSGEALRRLATDGEKCVSAAVNKDISFTRCLRNVGVQISQSHDQRGTLFHHFTAERHFLDNYLGSEGRGQGSEGGNMTDSNCDSVRPIGNYPITFRLDEEKHVPYMAYGLRPFGVPAL